MYQGAKSSAMSKRAAAKPVAKAATVLPPAKRAKVKTSPVKVQASAPQTQGGGSATGAGDELPEPCLILNHPTHFLMQESQIPNCIQVTLKEV